MSTTQPRTLIEEVMHTARSAGERWHAFWFRPADPMPLGLIRIFVGWMLFYNLWVWGTDLTAFFSADGLQPLAAITALHENDYVFSFLYWVPDTALYRVHIACMVVAAMFMLGVLTRVSSIMAFLITISYSQRVPVANFGLDQLLGMMCLYCAIGPSGASLSMDSWVKRRWLRAKGRAWHVPSLPSARMTLRLIQLHVCIIYFWAGFAKLKGDSWWTGEAMWQVIANQEYQTMDLTWMAWFPQLPYLIAHITVAWEVSFCVLVWNERLRPIWLAMGTAMHIGIGAFLGMWTFGLIMTFPYFAFSDGKKWRRRLTIQRSGEAAEAAGPAEAAQPAAAAPPSAVTVSEAEPEPASVDAAAGREFDPWAASEPYVTGQHEALEADARPQQSAATHPAVSAEENDRQLHDEPISVGTSALNDRGHGDAQHSAVPIAISASEPSVPQVSEPSDMSPLAGPAPTASSASTRSASEVRGESADTDAAQELFRQTMGLPSAPVRIAPAVRHRHSWSSVAQASLLFAADKMNEHSGSNLNDKLNNHDQVRIDGETPSFDKASAVTEVNTESDGDLVMDDDHVMEGVSPASDAMVYAATPSGLLDSATPVPHDDGMPSPSKPLHWQAAQPDHEISVPFDRDDSYSGDVMSEPKPTANAASDSPDASHIMTTSKRMDRIKPKTANSLTGAPPPKVEGRVEDSVLAPETEVLLVAVHAPERNTFRTYLRRHDIPCRAAVSSENAVSVVLGMKPAAVLISGSMMNPEEIITLVDDLNDMVDAPILALLTGSQIKLLSNDPLAAHVLQYPASLRQIRSELTGILLGEGNARPRCSLRSAMADE